MHKIHVIVEQVTLIMVTSVVMIMIPPTDITNVIHPTRATSMTDVASKGKSPTLECCRQPAPN